MRKNACKKSNRARASRGESMIMVAVMLMVFVILGAAVLTAASAATAASSARVSERQAYYYGRSLLDVLDESLRKGKLGEALRQNLMDELVQSEKNELSYRDTPYELVYTPQVSVEPLTEITFSDVTIACTGKLTSGTAAIGQAITRASLQLRTIDMYFTVTYHEQSMTMRIQYRGSFNVESYSAAQKTGTWTQDWVIQQVG